MAFIAVHVGAGYHAPGSEQDFRSVCELACLRAMNLLREGASAVAACALATVVLEDDPITNAGTGSSLSFDGFVECDAGIMDGRSGRFAACGAVPSVKNPIALAQHLQHAQLQSNQRLVPPMYLVLQVASHP